MNIQSNIEDLAECFKQLKLKLGECGGGPSPMPPMPRLQMMMYCIMCGKQGHLIKECSELKFRIGQDIDICHLDMNNQVVMSDGSVLP